MCYKFCFRLCYGNDLAIGAIAVISSLNMVFMMPIIKINDVVIN